jgi:hypothetical protein
LQKIRDHRLRRVVSRSTGHAAALQMRGEGPISGNINNSAADHFCIRVGKLPELLRKPD